MKNYQVLHRIKSFWVCLITLSVLLVPQIQAHAGPGARSLALEGMYGELALRESTVQAGGEQFRDDRVENVGFAAVSNLKIIRSIVSDATLQEVSRFENTINLAVGQSLSWSNVFIDTQQFAVGSYVAILTAEHNGESVLLDDERFFVEPAKASGGGGLMQGSLITTGAAVNKQGEVWVWGFRGSAQQGNGKQVVLEKNAPAKVQSLSNIAKITSGAYHLLALDFDGGVYGWGQSGYGETGCPGFYVSTPCKVLKNGVQIAAGEYFSIALDSNGQVWTWGHNLYGQLGNGGTKNSQVPVPVNLNGEKARLIGGAYEGAFAVTEQGHVWAWGDNEASGLGFQGTIYGVQKIIRTPTRVPNLDSYADRIVHIAGGNGWGEALLDDGTVIGWGLHAALGQGTTKTNISSPVPVQVMTGVKQLFARYVGSFALTQDGKLWTWGQTGGSAFPMVYGAAVTQRNNVHPGSVVEIGGGKEHLFYQTENGKVYGVGYNDLYKLNQQKCCGPNVDWPGAEIRLW